MRFDLSLRSFAIALSAGALLAGCGAMDVKPDVVKTTEAVRKGPQDAPRRTITGFSEGLRCMDDTMIFYGVRDMSALVEDLGDQTKKVSAGTKDMLISAMSDMTARSRALRLVTFGMDSGNLANFLANAETKVAYSVVPQYDIRGSISQLDENLAKKQNEASLTIAGIGGGMAKSASTSILGLDLNVISTKDYAVIPGVSVHNSVAIFKEGSGIDTEAEFKKFGISYGQTLTKAEGQSQALRTLVELAAIELMGKLTKTPYWNCLHADPQNPDIANEISNWFYAMSVDGELVAYMQKQLRLRGYYTGPVDGRPNTEFLAAVARSRADLGLDATQTIDLRYFSAFLNSTQRAVVPVVAEVKPTPVEPLKLSVIPANNTLKFKKGEPYSLLIRPSRDAHVYCYLRDDNRKVQRFYPNRFAQDSFVLATSSLEVPGKMRFQLVASDKGVPETIACFATERDVMKDLPATVTGIDFENLPVDSLDQIKGAFAAAAGANPGQAYFNIEFH